MASTFHRRTSCGRSRCHRRPCDRLHERGSSCAGRVSFGVQPFLFEGSQRPCHRPCRDERLLPARCSPAGRYRQGRLSGDLSSRPTSSRRKAAAIRPCCSGPTSARREDHILHSKTFPALPPVRAATKRGRNSWSPSDLDIWLAPAPFPFPYADGLPRSPQWSGTAAPSCFPSGRPLSYRSRSRRSRGLRRIVPSRKGTQVKIAVDASCWSNQRGYGRYIRGLIPALIAADQRNEYLLITDRQTSAEIPSGLAPLAIAETKEAATTGARAGGNRSPGDLWRLSATAHGAKADVLLFPSVYTYFPVLMGPKLIVAIHDVIAEDFPTGISIASRTLSLECKSFAGSLAIRLHRNCLRTCSRGIARKFGVDLNKITVVSEAAAPAFRPLGPSEINAAAFPGERYLGSRPDPSLPRGPEPSQESSPSRSGRCSVSRVQCVPPRPETRHLRGHREGALHAGAGQTPGSDPRMRASAAGRLHRLP